MCGFLKDFIYSFLERGREVEREGEKHQCVVASSSPPAGDLARNPGMCPNWESNLQPFHSQAGAQSTDPHWPGLLKVSLCPLVCLGNYPIPQLNSFKGALGGI